MPIHMTYDDVLEKVEKDPVGALAGWAATLNPQYQAVLDKYVPVGVILEKFFWYAGRLQGPQASVRFRDPFWFQSLQMQMQAQMAQQQQQQQGAGGPSGDGGGWSTRGRWRGRGKSLRSRLAMKARAPKRVPSGYWRRHGQCPSEW